MNRRIFISDLAVGLSAMVFAPKIVIPSWKPPKSSWKTDMMEDLIIQGWKQKRSGIWIRYETKRASDFRFVLFAKRIDFSKSETHFHLWRETYGLDSEADIPSCIDLFDASISLLSNDLEEVVLPRFPLIRDIKSELISKGALASLMTGSGSCTVFGIFVSEEKAETAREELGMHPGWQHFVCSSI